MNIDEEIKKMLAEGPLPNWEERKKQLNEYKLTIDSAWEDTLMLGVAKFNEDLGELLKPFQK